MRLGILPPVQTNVFFRFFRYCVSCNRLFALQKTEVTDATGTLIRVYRCKHCGRETEMPDFRPPECV